MINPPLIMPLQPVGESQAVYYLTLEHLAVQIVGDSPQAFGVEFGDQVRVRRTQVVGRRGLQQVVVPDYEQQFAALVFKRCR